jgi:hypothetical protein
MARAESRWKDAAASARRHGVLMVFILLVAFMFAATRPLGLRRTL